MQLCVLPAVSLSLSSSLAALAGGRGRNLGADFNARPSVPLPSRFTALRERVNSYSLRVYIIIKARLHGRRRRWRRRRGILICSSARRCQKTRRLIL